MPYTAEPVIRSWLGAPRRKPAQTKDAEASALTGDAGAEESLGSHKMGGLTVSLLKVCRMKKRRAHKSPPKLE